MNNSDELITARVKDLIRRCERTAQAGFSAFLDGAQQAEITEHVSFYGFNMKMFGGYDGAERKIIGVFPEWEEPDDTAFPISVLKIKSGYDRELTHRDYLGTLMGQGIDRSKTGDILIDGQYAYVFVCEDIAQYLADNIKKIGNQGARIEICGVNDAQIPEPKRETVTAVCASLRLDAVVAALCNLPRSQSAKLINASLVKLNYRECEDASRTVAAGDLISVRGHGRFTFVGADGETRKGRLHITAEKYI